VLIAVLKAHLSSQVYTDSLGQPVFIYDHIVLFK